MRNEIIAAGSLAAVAFDLDGTLYPNYRLNRLLLPFGLKEWRFLWALGRARARIRAMQEFGKERMTPPEPGTAEPPQGRTEGFLPRSGTEFYDLQAALMAEMLGSGDASRIREKMEALVYRGWEPLFKKIRPFPHVAETLGALKKAGLLLALLSDFPPARKLENMGIGGFWDLVLCTEETGRLKPDPLPFALLSRELKAPPGRILYVGNSVSYDVKGAKRAGMKTALIRRRPSPEADFCFHDYRQLLKYVIN
ncbi:MAG: HAD family hydrolase [Treponema sp.]|jgi:putative hydrolase of the HAD superfamily|nr:HAD family hydrolase [Treponema sp.]